MPVLSTIEVTLRDAAAERRFLEMFGIVAGQTAGRVPGLLELRAYRQLGEERTYLACSLWESEAHIEKWMSSHLEQEYVRVGKDELIQRALIRRFFQKGADGTWERGA